MGRCQLRTHTRNVMYASPCPLSYWIACFFACYMYFCLMRDHEEQLMKEWFLITRASVHGKPESENATNFHAKRGVMVPGIPCVDHGNWGRERDITRSWQNSMFCEESFGKYRALFIRSSRIQKCRSFSERVGPRVLFLKASQVRSCSKRSCEITTLTEPIAVLTKMGSQWLHVASAVII